jgi:hypothetical protein
VNNQSLHTPLVDFYDVKHIFEMVAGSMSCGVKLLQLVSSTNNFEPDDADLLRKNLPSLFSLIDDNLTFLSEQVDLLDESQPRAPAEIARALKSRLRALSPAEHARFWAEFGEGEAAA